MKKKIWIVITIIFAVTALWYFITYEIPRQRTQRINSFLDTKTNEVFNSLSTDAKISQVIHITLPGNKMTPAVKKLLTEFKPGGVILFGTNLGTGSEITQFTRSMQSVMSEAGLPPLMVSTDQEGGAVKRVKDPIPDFSGAAALGQTHDPKLCKAVGFVTSKLLREIGINVFFAPVLDINNNPNNPVIGWRSFGSSPETVINCAIPFEQGARMGGAMPVVKHFPGHGDTTIDSHLGLPIIEKDIVALSSLELKPFEAAIKDGAPAVMSAHIVYPALDEKYPSTLSKKIITGLLRRQLHFNGLVFTDAMEMDAISKNYLNEHAASLAIEAGVDVILLTSYTTFPQKFHSELKEDYLAGRFNTPQGNTLDAAVKRQIRAKLAQGLFGESNANFTQEDFLEQRARFFKQAQVYSQEINHDFADLSALVSAAAIHSVGHDFQKIAAPQSTSEVLFLVGNKTMQQALQDVFKQNLTFSDGYIVATKGVNLVIASSYEQYEIDILDNYARQFSDWQFILLHYGNPYLKMPVSPNVSTLLSFSPTEESIRALAQAPFGKGVVTKTDLLLQYRKQVQP